MEAEAVRGKRRGKEERGGVGREGRRARRGRELVEELGCGDVHEMSEDAEDMDWEG